MELHIKNMVCGRCLSSVQNIFSNLDISLTKLELGVAETKDTLDKEQVSVLEKALNEQGFEILQDLSVKQIEKMKTLILQKVQGLDIEEDFKISTYLSEHLHKEYSSLSKLFSQTENVTLEQYYILHKIEKVKELLVYNEYSLRRLQTCLATKQYSIFLLSLKK